jgi:hypothetical protein
VVDDEWHVGIGGFSDRLAVVEGFDQRQQLQIGLDLVGDLVQDTGALLNRRPAPSVFCLVGGIQREVDIGRSGAWNLTKPFARDRAGIVEVPSTGATHFPPIKLS